MSTTDTNERKGKRIVLISGLDFRQSVPNPNQVGGGYTTGVVQQTPRWLNRCKGEGGEGSPRLPGAGQFAQPKKSEEWMYLVGIIEYMCAYSLGRVTGSGEWTYESVGRVSAMLEDEGETDLMNMGCGELFV